MQYKRRKSFAAALLTAFAAAGCGSSPEPTTGQPAPMGDRAFGVEVRNTSGTAAAIDVFLVPVTGNPRLVGRVGPNETEMLTFEEVAVGPYRFLARTIDGRQIVSDEFSLAGARLLRWNLFTNQVEIIQRR